jgi:hypothetical protein
MPRARPVYACDCETDPFKHERVPVPFIWGLYGPNGFYKEFDNTKDFVDCVKEKDIILYAHNGGKFDFIFLLEHIEQTKVQIINGRLVCMNLGQCELRDSFSIIPVALKEFGFKLEIEHWKMEPAIRHHYMEEIRSYLFQDCKGLYDGVMQYRLTAGTKTTIASNALAFAKKLGVKPGKSSHRYDAKMRRFFFGGRCECFQFGTHHGVHLLDIHSAYPYAMLQDHATGTNFTMQDDFEDMTEADIQRSFIVLECNSAGAFPLNDGKGGLCFPHEFNEFYVTGWEYLTAKRFGLIDSERIISVLTTTKTITFKPYVDHWYEYKARHNKKTDPVNYTIGKIMMNSLYGKLAQNPARYYDYKIVPAGTPLCLEPEEDTNRKQCVKCSEALLDHGWELLHELGSHEIHRRESLWKWRYQYGVEWEAKTIYNNVATGASITGFTRAHLLHTMCTIGRDKIIYCDTDGIVCSASSDLCNVRFTPAIGDWEHEDTAPISHFAGKKLYAVKLSTGGYKIASKGSKLNQTNVIKKIHDEEIEYYEVDNAAAFEKLNGIVNGETVRWNNPAPTFSIDGSAVFIHRDIRATGNGAKRNKELIK